MPADDMLKFDKRKAARSHIKKADHKPHAGPEDALQRQCEEVLKIKRVHYIHIPNSLYRAARKQDADMFRGLPDLIVFDRGKKWARTLFVELKKATGKLSQGQKNFARYFPENYCEVRSLDDFVELFNEFIGGTS